MPTPQYVCVTRTIESHFSLSRFLARDHLISTVNRFAIFVFFGLLMTAIIEIYHSASAMTGVSDVDEQHLRSSTLPYRFRKAPHGFGLPPPRSLVSQGIMRDINHHPKTRNAIACAGPPTPGYPT